MRTSVRQLARHAVGRAVLHSAACHAVVSAFVGRAIAAPRTSVVLNCVETSIFRPSPVNTARQRFLYFGRFVAEKGVDVLLRAVALAAGSGTDVALDLVGAGPLESAYRALTAALGIEARVRFRGPLRGGALADAVRESLAVVVPSVWDEAFGIVAAEAICCGRIALVSDLGGLPEVVEGLGTCVPAGDAQAWAGALRRARDDDRWREEVEGRLPAAAARFTPERLGAAYLSIYQQALAAGRL
jgi:glycosyltransferase involved in cell wall biosynthesis